MALSDAVSLDRISKVVGYKLKKGDFSPSSPNLPQRIALFGEANTANQGGLPLLEGKKVSTAKEAGDLWGYGSPIHQMMRILKPVNGDGVGGIPIIVYPQISDGGAVASLNTITITGTASATTTHSVVINGRDRIDGTRYDFVIEEGDAAAEIAPKITDAINKVLGAPVIAATNVSDEVEATAKWEGVTSSEIDIIFDTGTEDAGLTYGVVETTPGAGTVDIVSSLAEFKGSWNTIVINPYGATAWDDLETFNGIPADINPTGRYEGTIFKPFIALTGATESTLAELESAFSPDTRKDQVTNAICPAPNSTGFTWEAAANGAYIFALTSQNNPHLDVSGQAYPDMPVPSDGDIGEMSEYNNRDLIVKEGLSTVEFINGRYTFADFVTTYRPDGEVPPQFRYCRSLVQDFNIRYGYFLLEKVNVVDHAIVENDQPVNVDKTIKPKQWIGVLNGYADDLAQRAIIVEASFMKDSLEVETSETNPDRLETFFRYKRSPFVRIASTTGEAGFAFGLR